MADFVGFGLLDGALDALDALAARAVDFVAVDFAAGDLSVFAVDFSAAAGLRVAVDFFDDACLTGTLALSFSFAVPAFLGAVIADFLAFGARLDAI